MITAILRGGPRDGDEIAVDADQSVIAVLADPPAADEPPEVTAQRIQPALSLPRISLPNVVYEWEGDVDSQGRRVFVFSYHL